MSPSISNSERCCSLVPTEHPSWCVDSVSIFGLKQFPVVKQGDNLSELICSSLRTNKFTVQDKDVIVVAQKVVSICEARVVNLKEINATPQAIRLSTISKRDPQMCQLVINESKKVCGVVGNMIVTQHKLGFDCTNAGIDSSNVAPSAQNKVSLLPDDPDQSAMYIRHAIKEAFGKDVAVLITDSFGKPDRKGAINATIGLSGIDPILIESAIDVYDRIRKSETCIADEIASAASLVMGKTNKVPVAIVRGVHYTTKEDAKIVDLLFDREKTPMILVSEDTESKF